MFGFAVDVNSWPDTTMSLDVKIYGHYNSKKRNLFVNLYIMVLISTDLHLLLGFQIYNYIASLCDYS